MREVPGDVAARRLEALLLAGSSYAARWMHQESDARARIDAALRLLRDTGDYPSAVYKPGSEADAVLRALADDDAETGRLDASLAALLRRAGGTDEAAALQAGSLEIWRQWNRRLPNNPFVLRELAAAESPVPSRGHSANKPRFHRTTPG